MANYHVSRRDMGSWAIIRENATRASSFEDTQREAEIEAKRTEDIRLTREVVK